MGGDYDDGSVDVVYDDVVRAPGWGDCPVRLDCDLAFESQDKS